MHKCSTYSLNKLFIFALYFLITVCCAAQNLAKGLKLEAEVSGTASSGSYAPLWLSSNRYGKVSAFDNSAYERVGVFRSIDTDSARVWKRGYGVDLMLNQHSTSIFFIQQAYIEAAYKKLTLSLGAKER